VIWGSPHVVLILFITFWNLYDPMMPHCKGYSTVAPSSYTVFLFLLFILILSALFYLYTHVFLVARKHTHQIYDIDIALRLNEVGKRKFRADLKMFSMMLLIFGFFFVSYIPYLSVAISAAVHPDSLNLKVAHQIFSSMMFLTSIVNPLTYAWKDKKFRKAYECLLRCRKLNHDLSFGLTEAEDDGRPRTTPSYALHI